MGAIQTRVVDDPDLRPFQTDLDKYYTISAEGQRGLRQRLRLWVLNADFRVVACYRFDQAVRRYHRQHRVLGLAPRIVSAVWRRRTSTIHHAEIDHRARIGPGLYLMHHTGVFVGPVSIGDNCVLHHNVTIGQRVAAGDQGVPRLGNDVWIGPGATITGDVTIGDGATISAGTVIARDVPPRALVAGNPGRVVNADYDNSAMLNYKVRRPVAADPVADEKAARFDRALAEYARLRDPAGDRHLEAVKAAIFLEDVFDVVLREDEIDPDQLGTAEGMRAVLERAGKTA
ncbi:serine acetyltransferase [Nocardioides sp. BE266]|uniref:serine O-acetyltransferase n=1 Tax=Nocardioides sp. BE266 TaxID=2817725 RepID=UPI00285DD005|nr:serine acetyltransferase [Nocardioides sp. BE266]MDR7252418.1 serine acetyltransferase [Nocardioides sp. BE266]